MTATAAALETARDLPATGKAPLISRRLLKTTALALALLAGATAASDVGYRYWTVGRYLEATDDAYVKADYTTVAPKVSGYIAAVLVGDNQPVKSGQALARIDDRDFKAALDQARADVGAAGAAIRNLEAQLALQQSVIAQERADIAATQASLTFARQDHARYQNLERSGYGTVQRAEQAEALLNQKTV